MSKEVKVGIALIMMLAITVGVLLTERMMEGGGPPAAEINGSPQHQLPEARTQPTWVGSQQDSASALLDAVPPTTMAPTKQVESSPAVTRRHSFMPKANVVQAAPAIEPVAEEAAPAVTQQLVAPQPAPVQATQTRATQAQPMVHESRYQSPSPAPATVVPAAAPSPLDSVIPQSPSPQSQVEPSRYQQQGAQWQSADQLPSPRHVTQRETDQRPAVARQNSIYSRQPSTYHAAPKIQTASQYGPSRLNAGTGGTRRTNQDVYQVQPNDNMWKISQRVYGTGAYFKALSRFNSRHLPDADRLKIGDSIKTPTVDELVAKYPELCPKQRRGGTGSRFSTVSAPHRGPTRDYEVRDNDTLFDIARFELGEASRWVEIYELNKSALTEDLNFLPPGTMLKLPVRAATPTDEPADVLTRQPNETTRH